MRAVVLVGGEGTRLRPLTASIPKQMLTILDRTMIEHVLGGLHRHGIDGAVLSLGYMPSAFLDAYPDGEIAGVEVTYAVEAEPLDTAGAIRFAATEAGIDDTFVVVNGDVLTDMDLSALVDFHRTRGAEASIGLHPVSDPSSFGVVPTDGDGKVTAFVEKPPRDEAPTNEINAGTYVLEPEFLKRIPEGRRISIERETFPATAREGRLFALADSAYWLDTGTPADYIQAHRDMLEGRRGPAPTPTAVEIREHLWVDGEATIEGAVIGPAWVGDGAVVKKGATLEEAVVGPGCVVEEGASVIRSVLLAGSRVAARASVDGSILGPRSTVGERCSVRPVSVIGGGTVVASGTVLDGKRVPA